MPKRYTEGYLREDNITDVDEFNTAYNEQKANINGGIDRDMIPSRQVKEESFKDDVFHRYVTAGDIGLPDGYRGYTAGDSFECLRHEYYGGGWFPIHSESVTTQAGTLHLEANGWYFANPYYTSVGNRWVQFRMTYDNRICAKSGALYMTFGNAHLIANIPVPAQTADVTIWMKAAVPTGRILGVTDFADYFCEGFQLLAIPRSR